MGCIHSTSTGTTETGTDPGGDPGGSPVRENPQEHPEILQLTELAITGSHTFTEKSFKRRRMCDVCKGSISNRGAYCRDCGVAVHWTCETEVTPICTSAPEPLGSTKSTSQKKRGSLTRSKSVEKVMEHVMEHHYDFDLTYITERIISVFFLPELGEQQYRRNLQEVASMLKSKHQDKFLLLNLSEKRHDITTLNPTVHDYGWPDLHAPPLDRICTVCKAMETWLTSDPQNVVVLHCKGNKGKTGVMVAAYMHYSKISAGADQALTTLAMRKFCEDKVSSSLQPSQNRYVYYFGGLLSGSIKMNSSPLFLHQVLVPSLPNFQAGGGFYPFLKIYQSLQLVYTSGVYDPQSSRARKLCVTLEPALLLKGDILVKCFHRRRRAAEREVVFRVQFHTCAVHGAQLWFGKSELDLACTDDRFPPDASVEFIFSSGPEKMKGREYRKNDASIKVDYNMSDVVVRWDSYENFNLHHQDSLENISHTRGPLDGSLYAQVRKRRGLSSTASAPSPNGCVSSSPTVKAQPPSHPQSPLPTSDCRHSSAPSHHQEDPSLNHPDGNHADASPRRPGEKEGAKERTKAKERDRETAILDDEGLSNPGSRREHPCYSQPKCGTLGWEREREPCRPTSHCVGRCNAIKNHPKSQTLPALPTKCVSPPPLPTHLELCHRHSAHPLSELPWERPPPPPPPCLHRACYPYSTPDHAHPHSHTLPASSRLCSTQDCHLFHFSSHGPPAHLSHPSLPSSPYRDMFFSGPALSAGCPCRDCTSRREHQSAPVRTFHPLHPDQSEHPQWSQGAGVQRAREAPPLWDGENQWDVAREAEFWQCKSAVPAFHTCHPPVAQSPTPDPHRFAFIPPQSYPGPQSLMDVRDGASSGYHTPPQPRHSCPCSPYQSSPAESHESRGYASGYHSGSASPLPGSSPSPGRGRLTDTPSRSRDQQRTEHHREGKATDVDDDVSQGSEGKSDSNGPSSTPGLDSDHDYTLIGSSSPTQTEDSATCDSTPQSPHTTPQSPDTTPQSPHTTPQSPHTTPQSPDTTPQSPDTTPQSPHTTPQSADTTPQSPDTTPQSPHTTPQSPDTTPQSPHTTPQSADTTPQSPHTTPQSPHTTPQSPHTTPQSTECRRSPVTGGSRGPDQASITVPPVQVQLNGTSLHGDAPSDRAVSNLSAPPTSTPPSPTSPIGSPELQSSPQSSPSLTDAAGPRLTPDRDGSADAKPPSPVPDGYHTPTFPLASYYYPLLNVPHVPYTGYTAVTIPPNTPTQPPLPEKKRLSTAPGCLNGHSHLMRVSSAPSPTHHVSFSTSVGEQRRGSTQSGGKEDADIRVNAKFVQDSSKFWYKAGISRDQAIAVLKDKEAGSFLIRDSNSFQGAYGLALKVATPPPNASVTGNKGDPLEQLVRHFLIETGPRGVKIKGCQNESYFGSLSALVFQHSITPISLPCALRIPEKDLVGELQEIQSATSTSTAADLLKQGAACNVLYLNSVETESLTGPEAVSKATKCTLSLNPRPVATVVHFKVSAQGITLTDSKRRLFFRRHYPINSVTFSSLDPQDQRWTNSDSTSSKMFGFVARRTASATENVCHLFAEIDPEQPAVAIVNFINKVMLGPQLRR